MRKIIFFLSVVLISSMGLAEVPLSPEIQRAREFRYELVQKQDELLELLLQIPFEQRQYVFPLLSASQSVPKKIKTHPDVLLWKGKKPTRIADRFKDDQELIEYLPEQFYYLLAPEMWPSKEQENAEQNPNQILKNLLRNQSNTESVQVMPEELVDVYSGLNIFQKWVQQQAKQPTYPLYFEKWATDIPQNIQKELKEKTGLSATDFGKRVDLIAQNYRLYKNQKIPPNSEEQKLVQQYWSLVPFIFQKAGFSDTLDTSLYQD